jgi:hypothetical protein
MQPHALKLVALNGKDAIVYQFFDPAINVQPGMFSADPTRASLPFGWEKVVDASAAQAARPRDVPAGQKR